VTRLRPRSITIELIILFVAVIVIAEMLSVGYRYFDHSEALSALESIRIADRVAVIVSLVNNTPPQDRPKLLENFRGSELPVAWTGERRLVDDKEPGTEARLLRDLLLRVIPHSNNDEIIVSYLPAGESVPLPGEAELATLWRKAGTFPEPIGQIIDELAAKPTFLVTVRLSDGTWLKLLAAYVEDIEFWPLRSVFSVATMISLIAGLSIWAIARLTAPFQAFAAAATLLGTDVNAEPIPERGPADVCGAIRAFNDMQTRLQRFIEDRTQMLAAVSHDLRTPITRLRLRAEYVESRSQRRKFLADLDEMEQMITGVLSFAKEDARSEPTVTVDLGAMLQSICDDLSDRGFDGRAQGGRVPPVPQARAVAQSRDWRLRPRADGCADHRPCPWGRRHAQRSSGCWTPSERCSAQYPEAVVRSANACCRRIAAPTASPIGSACRYRPRLGLQLIFMTSGAAG